MAGNKGIGEPSSGGQRRNLGADVYRILWDRILNHDLNPGEKLSDLRLSEQLGVSRTPVREALHRLAQDGVVRVEPNRGFFVASFSAADIAEIYDMRAALELWSLHALPHPLPRDELHAQVEALSQVNDLLGVAVTEDDHRDAARQFLAVDLSFHRWLSHQSANRRLIAAIEGLWAQIAVFQRASAHAPGWVEIALDHHRMILYLLSQEQMAEAGRALESHIMYMKRRALTALAPSPDAAQPERGAPRVLFPES